jgi:hypothetical protein
VSRRAADTRLALGSAAIVRPSVAASWLPFGDADGLRWLRARGLIHTIDLPCENDDGTTSLRPVEVVHWGEVEQEILGRRAIANAPPSPKRRRAAGGGSVAWADPEE